MVVKKRRWWLKLRFPGSVVVVGECRHRSQLAQLRGGWLGGSPLAVSGGGGGALAAANAARDDQGMDRFTAMLHKQVGEGIYKH